VVGSQDGDELVARSLLDEKQRLVSLAFLLLAFASLALRRAAAGVCKNITVAAVMPIAVTTNSIWINHIDRFIIKWSWSERVNANLSFDRSAAYANIDIWIFVHKSKKNPQNQQFTKDA
jgi:hypothetical protein